MPYYKRNQKTGLHRVNIPGVGWVTVRPGQPVLDLEGNQADCAPEVFGSQLGNYTQTGAGNKAIQRTQSDSNPPPPPQAAYVLQHKGRGYYDVVNPGNPDKPVNEKSMREPEAKKLLEKLLGEKPELKVEDATTDEGAGGVLECPYDDDGFGKKFDAWEECGACPHNAECKLASE